MYKKNKIFNVLPIFSNDSFCQKKEIKIDKTMTKNVIAMIFS